MKGPKIPPNRIVCKYPVSFLHNSKSDMALLFVSTNEGLLYARENGLFNDICPKLVSSAGDIIESLDAKYSV
jgi:hypothetical protein